MLERGHETIEVVRLERRVRIQLHDDVALRRHGLEREVEGLHDRPSAHHGIADPELPEHDPGLLRR